MAVTVEELQIVLGVDASSAQRVLDQVNAAVDKFVAKVGKQLPKNDGTAKTADHYEQLAKRLNKATEQADKWSNAVAGGDTSKRAKHNMTYYANQVKNITKQMDGLGKKTADAFGETDAQREARLHAMAERVESQRKEAERMPFEQKPIPMAKSYAELAKERADAQAEIERMSTPVNVEALRSGTPLEKLGAQLDAAVAKADLLYSKLQNAVTGGADASKISKLTNDYVKAESQVDKLAAAMDKLEAEQGASAPADNIKKTGEEADKATGKVERYNRALSKGHKGAGLFSKVMHGFGKSFHKNHGFLSRFGQTLKRVITRMLAMGLVRGVINSVTQGMKILASANTEANRQLSRFTNMGNAVKTSVGSAALSVLNALAPVLYSIASAAITAANAVARFFAVLGGGGTYFAVKMADSFDDLAESASGAGGAAKGMLAEFDELNVIGNKGGGGGGGGDLTGTTVGLEKAESRLADLLNAGLFKEAGNYVAEMLDGVVLKIDQWFLDVDKKNYGAKFAQFLNGIFGNKKLFTDIGKTVGDGINTVTHAILNFFRTFDARQAASSLAASLNTAIRTIDWTSLGNAATAGVNTVLLFVSTFLRDFDWLGLIDGITKLVTGAIEEALSNPITIIRIIGNFVIAVAKVIGSLVLSSVTSILHTIAAAIRPWAPELADVFTSAADDIEQAWNEDCDNVAADFDRLCDKLETDFESTKKSADTNTTAIGTSFSNMGDEASTSAGKVTGLQKEIDKLSGKTITITTILDTLERKTVETHFSSSGVSHGGSIGKFASGGIVYGNTLANVGEYVGARANPEIIAPLSDLQQILARSGAGTNTEAVKEQNRLLTEQNYLLQQIAKKEFTISPSASLGQVVARSNALYARS